MANNHDESSKKKIATVLKRINGAIFAINLFNAMFGMNEPKVLVVMSQPGKDTTGKNEIAKFYLGWEDVIALTRKAYYQPAPNANGVVELLKLYKGGYENKRQCVVARVFRAYIKQGSNGQPLYMFETENMEGDQTYTTNKYGQQVNGVVKPKKSGKSFGRTSIGLNQDEFFNIIDALKLECIAYRTAICNDMMVNPAKYNWTGNHSDNNTASDNLATAGGWGGNGFGATQPPTQQPNNVTAGGFGGGFSQSAG